MTGEMETLSEATNRLTVAGYQAQFLVRGDRVECHDCDRSFTAEELTVDETVRFEGMSDPGDEAVLFAITDSCGHRGTLVATYGPDMSTEEAALVSHLSGRV
ncbi:MAG: hypothetical protein ACK5O2_03475 [Microthrixaceae bacterium]